MRFSATTVSNSFNSPILNTRRRKFSYPFSARSLQDAARYLTVSLFQRRWHRRTLQHIRRNTRVNRRSRDVRANRGIAGLPCTSLSDKTVASRSSNLPAICYRSRSYIKELEAIIQVAAESVKLNGIRVLLSRQRP